jgi:hypothetical protein
LDDTLKRRIEDLKQKCAECSAKPFVPACWQSSPPCSTGVAIRLAEEAQQLDDALDGLSMEVWMHLAYGTELPFGHVGSQVYERAMQHKDEHEKSIWLALGLIRLADRLSKHGKSSPEYLVESALGEHYEDLSKLLNHVRQATQQEGGV